MSLWVYGSKDLLTFLVRDNCGFHLALHNHLSKHSIWYYHNYFRLQTKPASTVHHPIIDLLTHGLIDLHHHMVNIFSARRIRTAPPTASIRLPMIADITPPSLMPTNVIAAAVIPMITQG